MRYSLTEGVVLFSMCEESFLFPSRKAKGLVPFIMIVPPELAAVLGEEKNVSQGDLSPETEKKLKRLITAGLVEER